ncbi:CBASS cGAMP-activated phospholipase [Roseovarius aestuarii]|uniref:Putative sporulation hydrolase CotR n=1 Tax=Roseovarius aestuarii TaxID=475083 RepID=A0A1X7BQ87_9RHOB|nr:CBASS cGAMP-activated phospholipase [Roseovarius aestuarii]SMC11808.1 Putative sporulation hydrolase CotR [Roseovarius aestuarii]
MFRILCLDGGGILGAFTASVLCELEEQIGEPVSSHFDLIVGTSTGGILALGLGLGFSSSDLLSFYQDKGPNIFPHTSRFARARASLRQLLAPKLSQAPLRSELSAILGELRIGNATNRLVIPAYDAVEGRIYLFKTAHTPDFVHDIDLSAIDVALATSAAPTYFKAARTVDFKGSQYVDGGVWANNPSMIGLVEAVAFLDQPISEIAILSIGTTYSAHTIAQHEHSGALRWNIGLIDLLMRGQAESASAQAKLLLKDRYHRIDHIVPANEFSMDDGRLEKIERLVALGRNQARKIEHKKVVKEQFLNGVAAPKFGPTLQVGG